MIMQTLIPCRLPIHPKALYIRKCMPQNILVCMMYIYTTYTMCTVEIIKVLRFLSKREQLVRIVGWLKVEETRNQLKGGKRIEEWGICSVIIQEIEPQLYCRKGKSFVNGKPFEGESLLVYLKFKKYYQSIFVPFHSLFLYISLIIQPICGILTNTLLALCYFATNFNYI